MRKFEKISWEQFQKDVKKDSKLYESYELPKRKTAASAGYDFFAIEPFEIKPNEIKKIPTGIKAKYPTNEVLFLFLRSSMGFKYNIRMCNQVGVIDSDFYNNEENEGHIWFALKNEGEQTFKVEQGQAFGQGIFMKYYTCGESVETKRVGWSGNPQKKEIKNER